ncbi:hypothetical protein FRC09_005753 [Ceratobasidium sp. 395]|nr:hypothetical protein FRC09_005753 [Ceratobasidium sp. 395]
MSYPSNEPYDLRENESRRNQDFSNEYGSERRGHGSNEYGSGRREYGDNDGGIRTEAGRNAQGHFNSAAEDIGRAAASFDQGGGREAFESVGNPAANRNENEGEHVNPFLRPAQELAAATKEGVKGLPGAIFLGVLNEAHLLQEFATGQYEAHKVHPEGNRPGYSREEERRNEY